jgi:hypothetical protein
VTLPWFLGASQRHVSLAALAALVALAASTSAACVRRLPPAPTPQPVFPRIDAAAPPAGSARLVVDVVEGPTRVLRIRMTPEPSDNGQGRRSFRFVEATEVLCDATPCVADGPAGNVLLGFPVLGDPGATETELVHIGPEPTVYRRSLSVYESGSGTLRVLGVIGTSLGAASLITGTALLPYGLDRGNNGVTFAGGITLGAGAALLTLGILAIRYGSPTLRPGSSSHYPLAP